MSPERTVKATCLCGLAAHDITLPTAELPLKAYICHCDSCRHQLGTLCYTVAFLPMTHTPSQELVSKLQPYEFSKRITNYFCPTCGAKILARLRIDREDPGKGFIYGIPTGTLEDTQGVFAFQGHEHIQDTLDGGIADFLPSINGNHLERWPGDWKAGEPLSIPWSSSDRNTTSPAKGEKLHAHCHCKAVNFYISRPSTRSVLSKSALGDYPYPSEDELWYLRAKRTKFMAGFCLCNSCRLTSSGEAMQWGFVPTFDISLSADRDVPLDLHSLALKEYRSSPEARRYFCTTCGAVAFYDADDRTELKDVAMGLLASPDGARAEDWFEWRTERLSYPEDALERAEGVVAALQKGLKDYEERKRQRN